MSKIEAILQKVDVNHLLQYYSLSYLADNFNITKHKLKAIAFEQKQKKTIQIQEDEMLLGNGNEWMLSPERISYNTFKNQVI